MIRIKETLLAGLLGLGACSGMTTAAPPPAPAQVVAQIAQVCAGSGLFKAADSTLTIFVPQATLPVELINAGVDRVCADPTKFANDAHTVVWLVQQFNQSLGKHGA